MGVVYSLTRETFPPQPTFSVNDIPDLSGKVMIVTGANTGIGKETAKALLAHNATVYIAARNEEKSQAAILELKEQTGKEALFLKLDLADLKSIKLSVAEFRSKETQLHVLFNNAGVMAPPIDQLTADGYDMQFGTNVLGHYYLTKLLLPVLTATASSTGEPSRVINTSSSGHFFRSTIDFDTLRDTRQRVSKGKVFLYSQSKLGNILFSNELARRYGEQGIVSISLNPGNLKTDLLRNLTRVHTLFLNLLLYPAPMGALTQLYAGTVPEGKNLNGQYMVPWARVGKSNKASNDPALGKKLWDWLEAQIQDI